MSPTQDTTSPISRTTSLARWAYVLRYYRPTQLVYRAIRRLDRHWLSLTGARKYHRLSRQTAPTLRERFDPAPLLATHLEAVDQRADAAEHAEAIMQGSFCYLSQQRTLADPIGWDWPGGNMPSLLWRFHLHYQDDLLDLVAAANRANEPDYLRRAADLVAQWIRGNPLDNPRALVDGWHPYCIARRLPNWVLLHSALRSNNVEPPAGMLDTLFSQAVFLADHLEWDLGGNHLLEDLKAMFLAGAFYSGSEADAWLKRADRLLRAQLDEQILPHGEHYERSPMYHAQMLRLVLDVRDVAEQVRPSLAQYCSDTAGRMAEFTKAIRFPNGSVPLWGDSAEDGLPPLDWLLDRASVPTPCPANGASVVGQYWLLRDNGIMVAFDAGPVGPDHLPAHAHADLLSVQAAYGSQPLLIDSGVYGYDDDSMRRYCRSSTAHNVLQIDGFDQCDMWSRFRMGYRGWPTDFAHGRVDESPWCRASHNAYRRLGVARVDRWLAVLPEGPWLCVDRAEGEGTHLLSCRLLLHPEVEVQPIGADRFELIVGQRRLRLQFLAPGTVHLGTGWYCPRFGSRLEAPELCWSAEVPLPFACGWSIDWTTPACDVSLLRCDGNRLRISCVRSAHQTDLMIDATAAKRQAE